MTPRLDSSLIISSNVVRKVQKVLNSVVWSLGFHKETSPKVQFDPWCLLISFD